MRGSPLFFHEPDVADGHEDRQDERYRQRKSGKNVSRVEKRLNGMDSAPVSEQMRYLIQQQEYNEKNKAERPYVFVTVQVPAYIFAMFPDEIVQKKSKKDDDRSRDHDISAGLAEVIILRNDSERVNVNGKTVVGAVRG